MDTLRHQFCLSQSELAHLFGKFSRSAIGRYEAGDIPPLDAVIAYETIFGICPRDLLPGLYAQAEDEIVARASVLWDRLEGKTDHASNRKRGLLSSIIDRAEAKAPDA
jgi:transcriptional regulator with XRE-family HTH domain